MARLTKELEDILTAGPEGVSAFPHNDDLFHWIGTISGAQGTAYEGLEFQLSLTFPQNYPFEAPRVVFLSACYHPNVDVNGNICLDILKENWSAIYNVSQILLSIQSLLDNPNNASPLNANAAALWGNKEEFKKMVLATYESKPAVLPA